MQSHELQMLSAVTKHYFYLLCKEHIYSVQIPSSDLIGEIHKIVFIIFSSRRNHFLSPFFLGACRFFITSHTFLSHAPFSIHSDHHTIA